MKKLIFLTVIIFSICSVVYAAGVNGDYKGNPIVKVKYEGKELRPDDVPGQMIDGRTMVPVGMLRKAGFTVEWDQKTLTANITTKDPETVDKTPLTIDQVKELSNAVAIIYALDEQGKRWRQGTGFIINARGMLITAYHVAGEQGKLRALEVELNGKTYRVPADVFVFADEQKDIFGVYLQDPDPFPFLRVNDVLPEPGDDVYVIGNPEGQRNVVGTGDLTAVYPEHGRQNVSGIFPALSGASGGPLLDSYGQVIGIVTAGSGNVSTSTSILDAKSLYEQTF